jgi:RecA DNA recombination protein
MPLARADLESLLRARKLDRTLTTLLPELPSRSAGGITDEYAVARTGITALDARLGGGFPRGQISALAGAPSSGRASVLLQAIAAATARQELVAIVDVLDRLDVESADAAGVDLGRVLWIRGYVVSNPGLSADRNQRALEQALQAISLVTAAGNFGLVVFDAADAPARALAQLPFTTWRRLQRTIEGSQTACLLVGDTPIARSPGGVTVQLKKTEGHAEREVRMDVIRGHARYHEDVRVPVSAAGR